MATLEQQLLDIVARCSALPAAEQASRATAACHALLDSNGLNPTGDETSTPGDVSVPDLPGDTPEAIRQALETCIREHQLLSNARGLANERARQTVAGAIRQLVVDGFLHDNLVDKFRIARNSEFLDKGLHNSLCPWQLAMTANWSLNSEGMVKLALTAWHAHFPDIDLHALVAALVDRITFRHVPTLRQYRRNAMRHYPRLSVEEFTALESDRWRDVIDLPSGRPPDSDVPFITAFVKQGDIEHSLYRHCMMPDLQQYMRSSTPFVCENLDLGGADRNLLFGLPFVIQQAEQEMFDAVKSTITGQIRQWAKAVAGNASEAGRALAIAGKLWNHRRTPAAQDTATPVDTLVKGFTATIRNAFTHFTDINIAATLGSRLDPLDVGERFVLFASVSNGQLDNLAAAYTRYLGTLPDPAQWDNEAFFCQFLAVNREVDVQHIQPHFVVDKTRGCPAIPQIARFHAIVFDLVLDFALREFGEANIRRAGDWFLQQKTPPGFA